MAQGLEGLSRRIDSIANGEGDLASAGGGWLWEPVGVREFVESHEHMDYVPLSDRQYSLLEALMGYNPKKTFGDNSLANLAVAVVGKGGGKNLTASFGISYAAYLLMSNENPQKLLGIPPDEPIDFINVARNFTQASTVFFDRFVQRLMRWNFLKKHYLIIRGGSRVSNPSASDYAGVVNIGQGTILFPNNTRAFSQHAQNQSWEGFNIAFFVLDEFSSFVTETEQKNAEGILNTLRTSASTRFQNWKGIVMSYLRQEDDPTLKLYFDSKARIEEAKTEGTPVPRVYLDWAYPWEWKPASCYSGDTFKFEFHGQTYDIPVEYQSDFDAEPEDSACKILNIPPKVASPWIEFPERIDQCVSLGRLPLLDTADEIFPEVLPNGEVINYLGKKITKIRYDLFRQDVSYVMHIDAGEKSSNAALSVGHVEDVFSTDRNIPDGKKLVHDLTIVWVPEAKRSLQVSLMNVEDVAEEICRLLKVRYATWDHWNSATGVERMIRCGVQCERHNIKDDDYRLLRSLIYTGCIDLLPMPIVVEEIKSLVNIDGGMGRGKMKKDVADTIAGISRPMGDYKLSMMHRGIPLPVSMGHNISPEMESKLAERATMDGLRQLVVSPVQRLSRQQFIESFGGGRQDYPRGGNISGDGDTVFGIRGS